MPANGEVNVSIKPLLPPGAVVGIDHRTFPCPGDLAEHVREFWENLNIIPRHREVLSDIDEFGTGTRIDLHIGDQTITYALVSRDVSQGNTQSNEGHIGLKATPQAIRLLVKHPCIEPRGLVRWGTHDFSVTLRDPIGNRIEFRCPSAPHDLDDLID